ncbi:MAG: DUF1318 domain-containing protein [candidate division Zixibacteria bacterium]|nr:DUF1318 domain-containing protein [candidate division Zixibacteria bacterium]
MDNIKVVIVVIVYACVMIVSCTVKPPEITVTGEKTVLEHQLLGQYKLSTRDIYLPAADGGLYQSYRSSLSDSLAGESALVEADSSRIEYLNALARQRFNYDDIEKFKDLQVAGEGSDGLLHIFEDKAGSLPDADRRVLELVVEEENSARGVLMDRVITLRADLTEEDLPQVQRIFAAKNIGEEKAGRMVQGESGEWRVKEVTIGE